MSEHTPGPWHVKHRCVGCDWNDDESSGLGLEIVGPPEPMLRGQFAKAADAHLIAAAPDLLEALEKAVARFDLGRRWHEARGGDQYPDADWVEQARAAIAKARGET